MAITFGALPTPTIMGGCAKYLGLNWVMDVEVHAYRNGTKSGCVYPLGGCPQGPQDSYVEQNHLGIVRRGSSALVHPKRESRSFCLCSS